MSLTSIWLFTASRNEATSLSIPQKTVKAKAASLLLLCFVCFFGVERGGGLGQGCQAVGALLPPRSTNQSSHSIPTDTSPHNPADGTHRVGTGLARKGTGPFMMTRGMKRSNAWRSRSMSSGCRCESLPWMRIRQT